MLVGDVARRTALRGRELERDVRRVVAVLGVAGTLEIHGRTRDLGECVCEAGDGIGDRHGAIVGGGRIEGLAEARAAAPGCYLAAGTERSGTTTPSRCSASCTSSRAL